MVFFDHFFQVTMRCSYYSYVCLKTARAAQGAYNFVIHTAPRELDRPDAFHWRLELFPRLTKVAGFEWGSDCYINPLSPEEAARQLRNAGV